jgi:hypothetical protein
MYRSLYQILNPKVESKASGLLRVLHISGQSAAIQLDQGVLVSLIQGKKVGLEAANTIFRWINVAVLFEPGETGQMPAQKRLNTAAVLNELKKVDARIAMFKELIGGCNAIFQFAGQQIDGAQQFTPQDLTVSFLLNGKATIKEVQCRSQLNELDLLVIVCKLIKAGLVRQIAAHQPMASKGRKAFLEELHNTLADITGPVASVLIADAFDAIGAPAETLAECDIPHLFALIALHLEDDEKKTLLRLAAQYGQPSASGT